MDELVNGSVVVMLAWRAIIFASLFNASGESCPTGCKCQQAEGRFTVDCSHQGWTSMPSSLPLGIVVLDMNGNNFVHIRGRQYFPQNAIQDVRELKLRSCGIKTIKADAFKGFVQLRLLDMAKNELVEIPNGVFSTMVNLQTLDLSLNKLNKLITRTLHGLTSLTEINLSHNEINSIIGNFDSPHFAKLKSIDVRGNRLHRLKASTFDKLTHLTSLDIFDNPFECDCSIRDFVEWQRNKYLTLPPKCRRPPRLGGKSWDALDLDEFACAPDLEPKGAAPLSLPFGTRVTLTCTVDGDPRPTVKWQFHNSSGASTVVDVDGDNYELRNRSKSHRTLDDDRVYVYNLTIRRLDSSNVGVYHCKAVNRADTEYIVFRLDLLTSSPPHGAKGRISNVDRSTSPSSSSTTHSQTSAHPQTATQGANLVIVGSALGGTISLLTICLLIFVCYRQNAQRRQQRFQPTATTILSRIHNNSNSNGYSIVDNERPTTTTNATTIAPATGGEIVAQYSISNAHHQHHHQPVVGGDESSCVDLMQNSFPSLSIERSIEQQQQQQQFSYDNYCPKHSAELARSTLPASTKPKRVLRFALEDEEMDEYSLEMSRRRRNSLGAELRETQI